jgi:very-short-patch-repair endonuclease
VAHDENRDGYLRSLGITILRFPNEAVLRDLKTVLLNIADEIDRLAEA